MPPRGLESPKLKRMYEHIKQGYLDEGVSEDEAEERAARTVNDYKKEHGLTKEEED